MKFCIDWPAEREDVHSRGKLDERFLLSRAQPQRRGSPFLTHKGGGLSIMTL